MFYTTSKIKVLDSNIITGLRSLYDALWCENSDEWKYRRTSTQVITVL